MISKPIQGIPLDIDILDLLLLDNVSFIQHFNGIFLQRRSVRSSNNRRIRSFTQISSKLEILDSLLDYSIRRGTIPICRLLHHQRSSSVSPFFGPRSISKSSRPILRDISLWYTY